ncbi:hypothetical protein RchiOBHm_Chr3g0455811 [Rosa chinensis]|uniref:TCTP domain-containing protein n=1 Tax=Rosa chinensis TaxID=74649 RepID=A0A2P6R784_ROSCH|nr:hypothetical protein RchiOBHm_Chr3g0455811 [Rosa chinensis]
MYDSDELLSDSYPYKEIENVILWEVEGKQELFKKHIEGATKYLFWMLGGSLIVSDNQLQNMYSRIESQLVCISFFAFLRIICRDFDICGSFVGESMHDDESFAYYKEGATEPTFIYLAHGLKEVKC